MHIIPAQSTNAMRSSLLPLQGVGKNNICENNFLQENAAMPVDFGFREIVPTYIPIFAIMHQQQIRLSPQSGVEKNHICENNFLRENHAMFVDLVFG